MDRKQTGRIGLSMAINYFTLQGYIVSLPMNDTQWYDLIIEKDGIFKTVQCKATQTNSDDIKLISSGGTKGKPYDSIFNHPNLDFLFCVNKNLEMWLIPIKELPKRTSIKLRSRDNKHNTSDFKCFKYYITIDNGSVVR